MTLFFQHNSLSLKTHSSPNAFGLYIADNIYKPEIVADDKYIFKAGDNGYFKNYISKKLAGFSLNPFYNTTSIFLTIELSVISGLNCSLYLLLSLDNSFILVSILFIFFLCIL